MKGACMAVHDSLQFWIISKRVFKQAQGNGDSVAIQP